MSRYTRVGLAAVAALTVLSIAAPASAASSSTRTRWVDDDGKAGPTSCGGSRTATRSIQSAINRSDRNDVVIVCPGTYTGRVGLTGSSRNGMTVRAYSSGTAILKPPATLKEGPVMWVERVSDVTVRGLTVSFPSTGCGPREGRVQGLWVEDADGTYLRGNRIVATGSETQGACGYDHGMRVLSSSRVRVSGNTVRDFKYYGILYEQGSRGLIDTNTVQFYHGASGSDDDGEQGITVTTGARAEVTQNLVRSLSSADAPHLEIGIVVQNGDGVSNIHHNDVWYTTMGVGIIGSGTRIASNDVRGSGQDLGIHVMSGAGTSILSNRVRQHDTGIYVEASGTTIRANDARGNEDQGCYDSTSGDGTAGTANTWSSTNQGSPASSPAGICQVP